MELKLIDILRLTTVSSKDDGKQWTDKTRLWIIQQLLASSRYTLLNPAGAFKSDLYLLYGVGELDKSKKYIVVSSHIDTEMKRFFVKQKEKSIFGTFDNSITNASVIHNMLGGNFNDNILIAFTGNEENGMRGAKNLHEYLSGYDVGLYMVLDVTWEEHYGNTFTLENVKCSVEMHEKLLEIANSTHEKYLDVLPREFDDETEIYSANACFSFCIPINNDDEMHSDKGVNTTLDLFEKYTQAMPKIANNLRGAEYEIWPK